MTVCPPGSCVVNKKPANFKVRHFLRHFIQALSSETWHVVGGAGRGEIRVYAFLLSFLVLLASVVDACKSWKGRFFECLCCAHVAPGSRPPASSTCICQPCRSRLACSRGATGTLLEPSPAACKARPLPWALWVSPELRKVSKASGLAAPVKSRGEPERRVEGGAGGGGRKRRRRGWLQSRAGEEEEDGGAGGRASS